MRDSKGRFTKGHEAIPKRDSHGRFISGKSMEERHIKYLQTRKEVDSFLKNLEGSV